MTVEGTSHMVLNTNQTKAMAYNDKEIEWGDITIKYMYMYMYIYFG